MNNTTPPPMPSLQPKSGIPDVLFMIIFIAGLVYKGIGVITSSLSSFMIFGGFPGGGPELRAHCQVKVIGCSLGSIAVTKQYGGALQHAKSADPACEHKVS